ncbi:hypothetical protein ACIBVL_36175 [Streptomyces sp. NPDC049687]|uniref:hypothetical protein n=1 Tax=Streptomyces sp. NPDC049687 TaxID=3365596 RepID=UPI00379F70F1
MSGLGELDRPGAPESGEARDERSEAWVVGERAGGAECGEELKDGSAGAHTAVSAPEGALGAGSGDRVPPAPRRGTADPVKALMHRHRELCERAVDPLEIAAGLEAQGVTDRTAARFRHRDVFSLAEEMYARVSRGDDTPARPTPTTLPRPRLDRALLSLLPGALCAGAVAGLRLTQGRTRLLVATAGILAVTLALHAALRRGPLSPRGGTRSGRLGTAALTCWLLAYAALGDGLLRSAVEGGPDGLPTGAPDGSWPLAVTPLLTLTLACAPAAWCAHLLATRARRRLDASRGLEEFTASVQPLLLGVFALFLGALAALTALCAAALGEPAAYARILTLGALLFLARLLTVHGFSHAPAVVLGATVTAEALALATVFAGRLPRCGVLSVPVETLVTTHGPASVPVLLRGAATLLLLIHATRTLTRASAHARTAHPC